PLPTLYSRWQNQGDIWRSSGHHPWDSDGQESGYFPFHCPVSRQSRDWRSLNRCRLVYARRAPNVPFKAY
ncbi:hypothetical protein NDU88_006075, partial [Pleurodeles waltl]